MFDSTAFAPTMPEAVATLRWGTVSAIDPVRSRARVRLSECDGLRTAWLAVLQPKTARDKHYRLPDVGEHVAVLLDARGEDGLILGAIYSERDAPPAASVDIHRLQLADGAVLEYNRAAHTLTITGGVQTLSVTTQSAIELSAPRVSIQSQSVTIDAPTTTVTGRLHVAGGLSFAGGASGAGDLALNGNITASGSVMDAAGNSNHHTHD